MPSLIGDVSFFEGKGNTRFTINSEKSKKDSTPNKRQLRSGVKVEDLFSTPSKTGKSPRRSINGSPNSEANGICIAIESRLALETPRKKLVDSFPQKDKWNPEDPEQMRAVKEALHLSTPPSSIVCREEEQKRVLEFCKGCIQQDRSGSLYICGCPGTGKTLSMEKVKQQLQGWVEEEGFQVPDVLTMTCTSLTNTSEIFSKILEKYHPHKKISGALSPLEKLQKLFSQKQSADMKMIMIVADELDYLITRDRSVLHDLFMLTTLPFSRCILIGIANAIDLADRFLPKLQSLNCKPMVVTFRAYSKDQILRILHERLVALPYDVFQPQALELCARKVSAASGDMRKALCVCRSAIEMFEAELREMNKKLNCLSSENESVGQPISPTDNHLSKQEINMVRVDHMAAILSKVFKSGTVNTIQSLPQHQQMILCSIVKLFQRGKKDSTVAEMNKCYSELCKSVILPPSGSLEFTNMLKVLSDQGIIKLGQSKEDRFKRVTLKVDEADITFALQGIRFFRNCLQ